MCLDYPKTTITPTTTPTASHKRAVAPQPVNSVNSLSVEKIPPSPKRAVAASPKIAGNALSSDKSAKSSGTIKAINSSNLPNSAKPKSSSASASSAVKSVNGTALTDVYECPTDEVFQLFPTYCTRHGECIRKSGSEFRCCKQTGGKRCVKAVARPIPEPKHERKIGAYILIWILRLIFFVN